MDLKKCLEEKEEELEIQVYSVYLAFKHPRVPLWIKLFIFFILVMALNPMDIIPDFIPVVGMVDDVIVIPIGIAIACKSIPKDVMAECRAAAEKQHECDDPRMKRFGRIALLTWLAILFVVGVVSLRGLGYV